MPERPAPLSIPSPLAPCLAVLVVAGASAPAQAQTVEGRVVDARTDGPVPRAYVALVPEDRRSVVGATADGEGDFSLEAPFPGSYFVYASSLGYEEVLDGVLELGEDGLMEIEVRLEPDPLTLDSVGATVERTDRYLRQVGFHDRRARGWGRQLTREEIRVRGGSRITDAIRDIPRVRVIEQDVRAPAVVTGPAAAACPPHIFLDGMLVHRGGGDAARPDAFVEPEEVEGIEIYRSAIEAPIQYALPNTCGVVLIWTRH